MFFVILLGVTSLLAAAPVLGPAKPAGPTVLGEPKAVPQYGKVGLHFEPNEGQWDGRVRFLARGSGYTLFLTETESVLRMKQAVLRMKLVGSTPTSLWEGVARREGVSNYYGPRREGWRTGVPQFEGVKGRRVYPGIDVVYRSQGRNYEYDFVVAPGADPNVIRLAWEGARAMEIGSNGDLVLETGGEPVVQKKPRVYQDIDGKRVEIAASFARRGDREVGFELGAYDRSHELVIDPVVIVYSTFLGGSLGDDINALRVDPTGTAYVTGSTGSSDFPNAAGPDPAGTDVFVARLNAAGSALLFAAYLGGGGDDVGTALAIDNSGNAYVVGRTASTDFVSLPGNANDEDAFIVKLNASGVFQYGRYIAGGGFDVAYGVAVDSTGAAYVGGSTTSTDFVVTGGAQGVGGGIDAFIAKINSAGSAVSYFTYIGGSGIDEIYGMAVDSAGSAYAVGNTTSSTLVKTTPIRNYAASTDAFAIKMNTAGTGQVWGTYLGGTFIDIGNAIDLDSSNAAYITGSASSPDFPVLNGATGNSGGRDVFVAKINSAGNAFEYSTLFGGSDDDNGQAIVVQGRSAYVAGYTQSTNFPRFGASQTVKGPNLDAFLFKVTPGGRALVYSTFLGGSINDQAFGVGVDSTGAAYLAGITKLPGQTPIDNTFPVVVPFDGTFSGVADGFVTKYQPYNGGVKAAALISPNGIAIANLGDNRWIESPAAFDNIPGIFQAPNGDVYVAARSVFNTLYSNVFRAATQTWGSWTWLDQANLQGKPSVSASTLNNTLTVYVVVRDVSNNYYLVSLDANGNKTGQNNLQAANFATDPVTTACPDGNVYVVGKDRWNGLWSRRINPNTGLGPWVFGGGLVQGRVDVACGSDNIVYIMARDWGAQTPIVDAPPTPSYFGSTWLARVSQDAFLPWLLTGGSIDQDPRILRSGTGSFYIVVSNAGGLYYNRIQEGGNSLQFDPWVNTGFVVADYSAAASGGDLYLVGRLNDKTVYVGHETARGLSPANSANWGWARSSPDLGGRTISPLEAAPR